MYHLPIGKVWDAKLLLEALQRRGVKAMLDGERIAIKLPIERIDIDRIVNAKTLDDLKPEVVGSVSANISHTPNAVLENITIDFPRIFEADCFPRLIEVTKAILDCGYDTGNEQELANKYYSGEIDINSIFEKIEVLQIEKEQAVVEYRFEDALAILEQQRPLKQQIEDLLRGDGR